MTDWKKIRDKFPALNEYCYLNCAEGSPIAEEVAEAAKNYYDGMKAHGDLIYEEWLDRVNQIRRDVADYIGADSDEIAFTTNTSSGMNVISQMLRGEGDVITMRGEFPSSTLPWLHNGYTVRFVDPVDYCYPISKIEGEIDSKSRILVSSHIQYSTGFRQDLDKLSELAKRHQLYFVLNATQSFGTFPINVKEQGIDFLCTTGLKWTMSGYGIGICFVSKRMQEKFTFPAVGWKSVEDPNLMDNTSSQWKSSAQMMETGCLHFPNIFALGAAIDLFKQIGPENITHRILELSNYAVRKLQSLRATLLSPVEAEEARSGTLVVKVRKPEDVKLELRKKGIILSKRGGGLRISCHIYNSFEDIDHCVEALKPHLVA